MFETTGIRPVRTAEEYEAALARIWVLMNAGYGTPEGLELDILADYVMQYESDREPMVRYPAGEAGVGVARDELAERFPRLFHIAAGGSWPMIERHGLLSRSGLLDLFGVSGGERRALESRRRPEAATLRREGAELHDAPCDGTPPEERYKAPDSKAFFWPTRERLERMLEFCGREPRTILIVDTASLLGAHFDRVRLSPTDGGPAPFGPSKRGRAAFMPPGEYPFREHCAQSDPGGAVAEIAVEGGVPDIREHVLLVEERGGGAPPRAVWRR